RRRVVLQRDRLDGGRVRAARDRRRGERESERGGGNLFPHGGTARTATPAWRSLSSNFRARGRGARGFHYAPAEHVIDEPRERIGRGCDLAARAAVHEAHDLGR